MDLSAFLVRRTLPRPFLVAGVGGMDARLETERVLRLRGWKPALSPGEANMLIVCAPPHHGLDEVIGRLWDQIPSPRSRTQVSTATGATGLLDAAAATLVDVTHQRQDAAGRTTASFRGTEHHPGGDPAQHDVPGAGGHSDHDGHHGGHDAAGRHQRPAGHDMAEHLGTGMSGHVGHDLSGDAGHDTHAGHGAHAGHDMGGMDMPGGIAMAERGGDRDGLKLDRLHVPLGPALPDWPVGLVLRLTLQGDVIQEADVGLFTGGGGVEPWGIAQHTGDALGELLVGPDPVARLDSLQRLLFVAGWPAAAMTARRLRDDLRIGVLTSVVRRDYERWSRRVRRSRLLRWSTDGVGVLGEDVAAALRGDATARWTRWLDDLDSAFASPEVDGQVSGGDGAGTTRIAVDVLGGLLVGQEFAAARLIVASLDPDIETLVASRDGEMARG